MHPFNLQTWRRWTPPIHSTPSPPPMSTVQKCRGLRQSPSGCQIRLTKRMARFVTHWLYSMLHSRFSGKLAIRGRSIHLAPEGLFDIVFLWQFPKLVKLSLILKWLRGQSEYQSRWFDTEPKRQVLSGGHWIFLLWPCHQGRWQAAKRYLPLSSYLSLALKINSVFLLERNAAALSRRGRHRLHRLP